MEKIKDEQKRSKMTFLELPYVGFMFREFYPREYFLKNDQNIKFVLSQNFMEHILNPMPIFFKDIETPIEFGIISRENIVLKIFYFMGEEREEEVVVIGCCICPDGIIRVVTIEKNDHGWFCNCSSIEMWLDRLEITPRKKK